MKAVILAGGIGSRIAEETATRPKPMVEIGGKPILWHIMKIYSHYGVNDFVICLGYRGYDTLGGRYPRQRHPKDPIRETFELFPRRLQGQPRLADAARPDQAQQPPVGGSEARRDLGQVGLPSDKGRRRGR